MDINQIRGCKENLSKQERLFWDEFPGLLCDDNENKNNKLIQILRNKAIEYFIRTKT